MTTEQEGVSPATAGGAPAPTIPPEQVRAAAEYLARMVGCFVTDETRDAEIERLRGEIYSANVALGGFVTRIATALGGMSFGDTKELVDAVKQLREANAGLAKERDQFVAERDEAREQAGAANADMLNALASRNRFVAQATDLAAERNRLRQELALIGEQAIDGYIAVQNKRTCPCKSRCDYNVLEDRCSDRCNCAAGRRWVAGDAEPEIGTTVQRTTIADYYQNWTRTSDGWHPNHHCRHEHAEQCSGLMFRTWDELPRPLVEVVGTDGE